MTSRVEDLILCNLVTNEEYARKVIPFLDGDYFHDNAERAILKEITTFYEKYSKPITKEILKVSLASASGISDKVLEQANNIADTFERKEPTDWLVEQTEKFCKDKSVYNAIMRSIKIIEGEDPKLNQEAIPKLLSDALAVSFDTKVGHEFITDAEQRWEFYHKTESKIPFRLKMLDKVTQGGMARKALYAFGAQSGGGKSLMMTHIAASTLLQGHNVLYITLEMAEERIAERIDANMLNIDIHELPKLEKDAFMTKIDKIRDKVKGRLFIKEYPTGSAHVGHFRALLEELKLKKDFKPELICVDYLGIMSSARMKMTGGVNTNTYVKSIAEELRGLAVEYDVPIVTGVQLNRGGFDNSDIDATNVADSIGLVMTLDFFAGMIRTEELDEQGTIMIKQLKNRYADAERDKRFLLGIDRSRMKFYDVETEHGLMEQAKDKTYAPRKPEPDTPLFDRSNGNRTLNTNGFKF